MALLVSSKLAVGVKVAVQVTPPSELATVLSVPLGAVRSSLLKPITARLKVMVTNEVSPTLSALSASAMVAVGALVSMVTTWVRKVMLPAASVLLA